MSAYREERLAPRFVALATEPVAADWLDVRRRVRRGRRRRLVVVTLAAALAVVLVGSALAVGPRVLDYFTTPVSDATAVVSGAGGRYLLSITNTGSESIRCITFRPAYPVELREPTRDFFDETVSGGPRLNMLTAEPNIASGRTWRVLFRTKRPYPRGAGGGSLSLNNPSFRDVCVFPGRKVDVTGPLP